MKLFNTWSTGKWSTCRHFCLALLFSLLFIGISMGAGEDFKPLKVVTTLPDYGCIARAIGQSRVEVTSIVSGNQDAHFIRPKPSFVRKVAEAHVLIATGLDLELWLPSVVNMSGNRHVASGQEGFVAAAQGMNMLEIPSVVSRSEGGLHLYGNPHVTSSPLNMRVAAGNICKGFIKNDPSGKELYLKGAADYIHKLDEMLFGSELVNLLGGDVLAKLAEKDGLIEFLESRSLDGEPLINKLGGVLKEALPLRNLPIVTYHKNWVYFCKLLGLKSVGTIEPKPGIPPSARHKLILLKAIKDNNVKVILSANYFNDRLTRSVAEESGAKAVIVPVYVGGTEKVDTYCALFRFWVESILSAVHSDE